MNAADARNYYERSVEAQFAFPTFAAFWRHLSGEKLSHTKTTDKNPKPKASK